MAGASFFPPILGEPSRAAALGAARAKPPLADQPAPPRGRRLNGVISAPFLEHALNLLHVFIADAFATTVAALQAVEHMLPHGPRRLKRPPAHVAALHAI